MRISIFGLGYVGAVTAGCLARRGHAIMGVDVQPQKVESFNLGIPPIMEPGLESLFLEARSKGLLRATTNTEEALASTEVSMVCVGTPSTMTGGLDLSYVETVLREIGLGLTRLGRRHGLLLRSTMLPGSTQALVEKHLAELEQSGRLLVAYYPEFLRESTAVEDFENPSLAVVGTRDGKKVGSEEAMGVLGPGVEVVDWATAEMVKYACNAFHATKVSFANEVGRVSKSIGVDSRKVMELLCRDTRLNLSSYYLKPGNPFGGSCLPKDVRALTHLSRQRGLALPVLESLMLSNERQLQGLLELILGTGQREVVLLGLAFKANTDDVRESAMVEVAQHLIGRGYAVRIFDPGLNLATVVGSNKRVIDTKLPHLATVLRASLGEALGQGGVVVVSQRCASISELAKWLKPGHQVVDVNGWEELRTLPVRYEGLCW